MQTHEAVAHLAFELGFGHQRRHGVHNQDVDHVRRHQGVRDLQRLLPAIRLRDQQAVDVDTQFLRVSRIERVFGIDKRRRAAGLLRFGDHVQSKRRLAGGFRPENLDYAPARESAHPERSVERNGAGRDHAHRLRIPRPELQHGAFAELLLHGDNRLHDLPRAIRVLHRRIPRRIGAKRRRKLSRKSRFVGMVGG